MTSRLRFCKHLWILVLLLAAPLPARAGVDSWTPFGPGQGALQSLTASSRGELYVTAGLGLSEIWQLPIPTVPWRWRNNGLGQPMVKALAVDPKTPGSLWAVSGSLVSLAQTVYHSNDGGGSWTAVFTGDIDFQVTHLWVAPMKKSVVLFAETGTGDSRRLLRSANGGVSWIEVPGVLGPVAVPPDQPGVVYAASTDGLRVLRSLDGGATFRATGSLPVDPGDQLRALHATYGKQASVFVSFLNAGLFRSANEGGRWRRVGFVHAGPAVLASEPKNQGTVYAVSRGLYASDKGGQNNNFRTLAGFFPVLVIAEPTALAAAPGGPYFLSGTDLYRYTPANHGSFELVEKAGIEAFGVTELRLHPANPSLLAVTQYTGCIRDSCDFRTLLSRDGGATFQRLGAQLLPHAFFDVSDLAFDPGSTTRWLTVLVGFVLLTEGNDAPRQILFGGIPTVEIAAGGVLLAGGLDGVQVSADSGATWQTTLGHSIPASPEHPQGGTRQIVSLAVNPYAPERVIAFTLETFALPVPLPPPSNQVTYQSTDAGHTWAKLLDGFPNIAFVPGSPASLFLLQTTANGTELRRSDDGGATFQPVHTFAQNEIVSNVAVDPSAPQDLYASAGEGVLRSHDGGATWELLPGDFTPWGDYRKFIVHVQVHPTQRGHLFAIPADGGLFENQLTD